MGVFDGIKVADFSWAAVGPVPGRILADHGATVVRVESINWLEIARVLPPWKDFRFGEPNTSGLYPLYNTNKYGAALNLRHPRAAEVAHRFVEWADVFTTAAGPGFMKRLGLDYESVSKVKPDIVYYATSMQGQTGSHSRHVAYGSHTAALCGFVGLAGWPDRDPAMLYGAYTDWFTPRYAVTVLIAALDRRRKTGQGMYIDHAQYETAIHFLEPIVLDYTVNGRVFTRNGNYDPYAAPHGAYRCRGEDRWVAIAVTSDEEWQGLCRVLGEPEWTREERFATLSGRLTNHAELDRLLEEWTVDFPPEQVMAMMQAAGVPAGVVQTPEDCHSDPQLKHRQHFRFVEHTEIGPFGHDSPGFKLSKTPTEYCRSGPCIGEHNEYVYKELLGMSDDELADLVAEGVIE